MTDETPDPWSGPLADLVPPLTDRVTRDDVERVLWRLTGWRVDQGYTDEFMAVVDLYAGQAPTEGTTGVTSVPRQAGPEVAELREQVANLTEAHDQLVRFHNEDVEEITRLRQELTAASTREAALADLRQQLDRAVEQLQGVWDELRDDRWTPALPEDLEGLPAALQGLLGVYRAKVAELGEANTGLGNTVRALNAQVETLKQGNGELDASVTELREALAAHQQPVTDPEVGKRLSQLATELNRVTRELEAAEEARDRAEVEGARLDAEVRTLGARAWEADNARQAAQEQMRRQAGELADLRRLREEEHAELVRVRDDLLAVSDHRDRLLEGAEVTTSVPSKDGVSAGQGALEVTERVTSVMLGQTLAELEERLVRVLQWARTTPHIREGLHVASLLGVDLMSTLRFQGADLGYDLRSEGTTPRSGTFESKAHTQGSTFDVKVQGFGDEAQAELKALVLDVVRSTMPTTQGKVTVVPVGAPTEGTKTCTRCGRLLTLDSFHRDKAQRDGRKGRCKECESEVGRERTRAAGTEVADKAETP